MEFVQSIENHDKSFTDVPSKISKFRRYASQYCAASPIYLLLIGYGTTLSYGSILLAELSTENSEIPTNKEDLTWISSINYFAAPISGLFSGILNEYLGSRLMVMIVSISSVLAWLIFYIASNISFIYVGLFLSGMLGGLFSSPCSTYIIEISELQLRGILSSGTAMVVNLGYFLQTIVGKFFGWRQVALISMIYPIVTFLIVQLIPGSPYWLASKGRFDESKTALAWLRGWTTTDHVHSEFQSLCKDVRQQPIPTSDCDKVNQNNTLKQRLRKIVKLFLNRSTYIPFSIVSFIFFIAAFNGASTIQIFTAMIFEQVHSPLEKYTTLIIAGLSITIASIITMFVLSYTGKRKLLCFSCFNAGLSCLSISLFLKFIDEKNMTDENLLWIPTILIISVLFVTASGITPVGWAVISEFFSINVRYVTTGILIANTYTFLAINNKIYLYMVDDITLPGTFLFYGLINFLGLIVLYFVMPETEGRTFREIEEHFAGIKNLKNLDNRIIVSEKFTEIDRF